jgi:hypothetical protein
MQAIVWKYFLKQSKGFHGLKTVKVDEKIYPCVFYRRRMRYKASVLGEYIDKIFVIL